MGLNWFDLYNISGTAEGGFSCFDFWLALALMFPNVSY